MSKVNEVKRITSSIFHLPSTILKHELNLLHDNGYLDDKQFDSLKHDMDRILKILTSIVKTLNEKVKKK